MCVKGHIQIVRMHGQAALSALKEGEGLRAMAGGPSAAAVRQGGVRSGGLRLLDQLASWVIGHSGVREARGSSARRSIFWPAGLRMSLNALT